MSRLWAVAAVVAGTLLAPGGAQAADPPPGAAMSDNLEYVTRVAGAANNQLADDPIADLLAERGILWAPDFVANAGGIINISVELEPEGYDARRARRRVRGIGDTLRAIYDGAAGGMTPLTAAMELARRRLAEPRA